MWAAQASHPAPAPSKKSALDKATLEAYLRHLQLWPAQVQVKIDDPKPSPIAGLYQVDVHLTYGQASQDDTYYVSKDGQRVIRGTIHDVGQNPFQNELAKLKTDLSPSFGAPGAPVVLVVFSDFQCPVCKEEAKVLRQNVSSNFPKDVRVYFKDFPLEAIHPWAKAAAIGGRCVFRQNPTAFWDYHDWIYDHQGEITPENLKSKVLDFANSKNLDALQMTRCFDTKATEAEVDKTLAEGKALHVSATPTMYLNGRPLIGNTPWQNLEQLINMERDYQKTANNAGEKCCEIKIPSPLNK